MQPYVRRAFYYETDQMSIVHHSNYIRWMEEARLDYMQQAGVGYAELEEAGVIMPVTSVECRYIASVHFDQAVRIFAVPVSFTGVRAAFSYRMLAEDGTLMAEGSSGHCFLDKATHRPLSLKRRLPELAQRYEQAVQKEVE